MNQKFEVFSLLVFVLFTSAAQENQKAAAVSHIVTGDIVNLSDGSTARLLCVDPPEVTHRGKPPEPFASEAIAFMRREFEDKRVRLDFDEQKDDGVGRVLAYIYREGDGLFLNGELLKRGLARVDTRFPCKHLKDFQDFEREAREKKVGLWGTQEVMDDQNQTQ